MKCLAAQRLFALFVAVGIVLSMASASASAKPVDFRAMMQADTNETIKRLKLTPAQEPTVKAILDGAIAQRMAVLEAYQIKPGVPPPAPIATLIQVQGRMDDIRTAIHTALTPVLKPDQLALADRLSEEYRGKYRRILLNP